MELYANVESSAIIYLKETTTKPNRQHHIIY